MSGSARVITEEGEVLNQPTAEDMGFNRIHVPQDVATIPPSGAQSIGTGTSGDLTDAMVFASRPKYPRRDAEIFARIKAAAQSAGASFYWSWPVKEKVRNASGGFEYVEKIIEGPSIKAAYAVQQAYQNCKGTVRVDEYPSHWVMTGIFIDGENGVVTERPYRMQKPGQPPGRMDRQRWEDMQFGSACSKAVRNVIVAALDRYCQYALQEAKAAIVGRIAANIDGARSYIKGKAHTHGIPERLVTGVIGRTIESASAADLARLYALFQSIEDGQIDVDEAFPDVMPTTAADAAAMTNAAATAKPAQKKEASAKPARAEKKEAPTAPAAEAKPATPTTEEVAVANTAQQAAEPASDTPNQAQQRELVPPTQQTQARTTSDLPEDPPPADEDGNQEGLSFG